MNRLIACALAATAVLAATAAGAEPYVDYTPHKGLWHITTVKVDPNHIDDYLIGLKKEWAPAEEVAKRHGLIDSYAVNVKLNAADGRGNVLLIEHIPDMALMEANQARDQMVEKETYAAVPKTTSEAQVKEFEKYRTFVGDDYYGEISFAK